MQPTFRIVSLALLVLGLAACGGLPAATPTPAAPAGSFVGRVDDSEAFVAVVTFGDGRALAYVCDSETIAEWFRGEVQRGQLDLASTAGARLQGMLGPDGWRGSFTAASGAAQTFAAEPASGDAGLYRAEATLAEANYVGGWILLPGGEQRGAIKSITDGTSNTRSLVTALFSPSQPAVSVPNLGTFTVQFIDPTTDF
jgi:hypothetical protein